MMYNYPYFYSPKRYSNYNYNYKSYKYKNYYEPISTSKIEKENKKNEQIFNTDNSYKKKELSNNSDEYFEIFGIKLFFDDILLICLIFFLYNEGVKDQYLFISLILLLIS